VAESVNAEIADRLTERQIAALRVESGLRRQIMERLRLLEEDILAAIRMADPTQFALLSRRRREVETLIAEEIDPLVTSRYEALATLLDAALTRLARSEADAVGAIVTEATEDKDEPLVPIIPPPGTIRRRVTETLFPSPAKPTDAATTGSEWWQRQGEGLSQRVRDTLLVSVALEESLPQMTKRIRGSQAQGYQDGVLGRARQDAQRLLTTQVTNTVGEARVAVADATRDRMILVHSSILDSSTSYICLSRNGLKFDAGTHEPIGHDIPYLNGTPYHPN
jgi:hypothetical protein